VKFWGRQLERRSASADINSEPSNASTSTASRTSTSASLSEALDSYALSQQRIWRQRIVLFAQTWLPLLYGSTSTGKTKKHRWPRPLPATWGSTWREPYGWLVAGADAANAARKKFDARPELVSENSVEELLKEVDLEEARWEEEAPETMVPGATRNDVGPDDMGSDLDEDEGWEGDGEGGEGRTNK
jgi:hypothetical protein